MTSPVQDAISNAVLVHLALRRETRKELAAVLGVTPGAVSHRLKGITKWSVDDLDRLAKHWTVSPAQLLDPPLASFAIASGSVNAGERIPAQRDGRRPAPVPRQRPHGGSVLVFPTAPRRSEVVAA